MAQTDTLIHPRTFGGTEPARPTARPRAIAANADIDIALSVHHDMAAAEPEWRAFEKVADLTPFQTFDWLSCWHRHVGAPAGVAPAIVIGRLGTEIKFLLPLAVEAGRLNRRLRFLGQDLSDYNAPLLARDFSGTFGAEAFVALWGQVRERLQADARTRHDTIDFAKMPATIGAQANPFLALDVTLNASNAYQTALGADWETFYTAKRSSATRRRDRTKLKRLSELGEVRFVTPDAGETPATFETLIDQKTRSFARMGVANLFARPGYAAFFRELAAGERLRPFVHISRLDVGTTQAAVNLGLTFRDCYYHILASYDDGDISRFGPGSAHLRELLHYAIDRGLARFDFTIGDEPYKRDWCDAEQKLYDHSAAATLRGWPVALISTARGRLKRSIKQTAPVWDAVLRMRAALSPLLRKRGE